METKKIETIGIARTDRKTGKTSTKQYATVDSRVQFFRENYKDWQICCEYPILDIDKGQCICVARVINSKGTVISDGIAYEWTTKPGSMVNGTSFIENAQTSAIGRALGFMGIGINGLGIATAEEVSMAIQHQDTNDMPTTAPVSTGPLGATPDQIAELKRLVKPEDWDTCAKFFGHEKLEELTYVEARKALLSKQAKIEKTAE